MIRRFDFAMPPARQDVEDDIGRVDRVADRKRAVRPVTHESGVEPTLGDPRDRQSYRPVGPGRSYGTIPLT